MPRDLHDCIAAELVTPSVKFLDRDETPSDAAALLTGNGYDAAPVYADDDPVSSLHTDDGTTNDDGATLHDHLTPLTIDYMIIGDALESVEVAGVAEPA